MKPSPVRRTALAAGRVGRVGRVIGVAGVIGVAAGAVSGCTATVTAAPTPAAAPAGSTAPATAVSFAPAPPATPAPSLTTTGSNWPTIVSSLITYGQWLLANPDPALAVAIAEPGCASANALTAELRSLAGQGAYLKTSPATITSIAGPGTAIGARVTVDLTAVRAAEPVYQRGTGSGPGAVRVMSTKAQLPATDLQLDLVLGADRRWRLCTTVDSMNDPAGEAITTLL